MQLNLAYHGRSAVTTSPAGVAVSLAPNLSRDRVSFEGVLRDPLHVREAVAALHDIILGDVCHDPGNRCGDQAHETHEKQCQDALPGAAGQQAAAATVAARPELLHDDTTVLQQSYRSARSAYWKARRRYANLLTRQDPELWRRLVPCDPVITVAPDCLFFEGFSGDESSYGCLTIDRSAFARERDVALGTTNFDYSWTLHDHLQRMRSYRETRFLVDPSGFEVGEPDRDDARREEIIDPPSSWLRGFAQLQAAMSLPMRRVSVAREGLYNVLAFLRRHRAARSPRAVRFELEPGRSPSVVLEPWDQRIPLGHSPYRGPRAEVIRIWGRDRLQVLARLLPILDSAEVDLLGTGLPSFWTVRIGPLRLVLGLSGWTAGDWLRGTALDRLAPPVEPDAATMQAIAGAFRDEPALTFDRLETITRAPSPVLAAGLHRLALQGRVIHDLPANRYHWRQLMPVALSAEEMGPEPPETAAARRLVAECAVKLSRDETRADGMRILEGRVLATEVSLLLDADSRMLRGRCTCSHHVTGGLRRGPCRHLQALHALAPLTEVAARDRSTLASWYAALWN